LNMLAEVPLAAPLSAPATAAAAPAAAPPQAGAASFQPSLPNAGLLMGGTTAVNVTLFKAGGPLVERSLRPLAVPVGQQLRLRASVEALESEGGWSH
jgi:hypothetical protein